jgi:hypothetical protein
MNHLQRKRKAGESSKVAASEPKQLRLEDAFAHSSRQNKDLVDASDHESDDESDDDHDVCNLCKK